MEVSNVNESTIHTPQERKYLKLLSESFPNQHAAFTEIINLQAILNLPKATEHFISDVHGEYEAVIHILNNCSGVIRERLEQLLGDDLDEQSIHELCTLIYYPHERLRDIRAEGKDTREWFRSSLMNLIYLARFLSNNYTRSKVRRAMPVTYAYIIDELLHEAGPKNPDRHDYHVQIIDSILDTEAAEDFIVSLCALVKRLAVDHLHVVGDLWDRGPHGDLIIDALMDYHSLDMQWGNHDVCWMGAAAGSEACVASTVRTNLRNNSLEILESGYGIPLRELALFAERTYHDDGNGPSLLEKAITVILFKLEGQLIMRRPEFGMEDRLLLDKLDLDAGTVRIDDRDYELSTVDFPTLDPEHPYELNDEERAVLDGLVKSFRESARLHSHIDFVYERGSIYRIYNDNLIYHGCIPLNPDGTFRAVKCGRRMRSGRRFLDFCDTIARRAWYERDQEALDWMYYLSCGLNSTVSGRLMKTFERSYVKDRSTWIEPEDPYWALCESPSVCDGILIEFGIDPSLGHIVNGHTPVHAIDGESPVRAGGKFLIIDGGFCEKYHKTTGIAGYTLISDDIGMRIKAHLPFESVEAVLKTNADIVDESEKIITRPPERLHIRDTDKGVSIRMQIADLESLLSAYRTGEISERTKH
ncbi:MAG: fructose-1,6-bisphosphatase [Atopobiaceae bacterium]|nr:fructose-1,6-bisphosphatase [Atopobiaceae bacterium]